MPLASCYVSLWDKDGCGHLRAHLPVAGKPQPQGKTPGEPFPGATTSGPLQRIGRRGGRPGSLANSGDWGNLRQQRQPACQRDTEQDRRLRRGSQWRRRPAPAPHRDPKDMSPAIRADEVGTVEEGPLSAVLAALARDDPAGVVAALDGQLHHGRPGSPAALRQQVGERLARALAPRPEIRGRGGVQAAKSGARGEKPQRVRALRALLQPLLRDEEPYVRRNLGQSAIGDGLLRVDPKETLKSLRQWSRDRDQIVRWNVAMAFSSAIGSFHWPAAKSILERLAKGPEPLVRNAVAKAMRRSRQRYTDEVEETRLRWLKDRDRAATAQLVGPLKKR